MSAQFDAMPRRIGAENTQESETGLDLSRQPKWSIPDSVVIKAALVGTPIKRAKSPHHPYTPAEIQTEVINCIEAGANSIHIHPRTDEGNTPRDVNEYLHLLHLIIDPVKEKYGDKVILDGCTLMPDFKDEVTLLESGLFEISPVNPFWRSPRKLLQAEMQVMQENGVKPEIALYSDGDLDRAKAWLIDSGIARKPLSWLLLPGYFLGGTPLMSESAMAEYLLWHVRQIRQIDADSIIMVCMAGRASSYLTTMAMLLGLHVRVGMEDTYFRWPHKDDIVSSNAQVAADTVAIARLLGRRVATANEYRTILGLPTR